MLAILVTFPVLRGLPRFIWQIGFRKDNDADTELLGNGGMVAEANALVSGKFIAPNLGPLGDETDSKF